MRRLENGVLIRGGLSPAIIWYHPYCSRMQTPRTEDGSAEFKQNPSLNGATAKLAPEYFRWRGPEHGPRVELPPGPERDETMNAEWRYPLAVLAEAEKGLEGERLRFYLTKNPNELPEYGNHIVAVLWQEERCKIPRYARHVRGVIRCLRERPFLGFHPRLGINKYEAVLCFQYVRDQVTHWRSRYHVSSPPADWPARIHNAPSVLTIPLGYHSQEELPQIPMAERNLDAFFTGELRTQTRWRDYRHWTSDSKTQSRLQLWAAMLELKKSSEWRIEMADISGGNDGPKTPLFNSYSQRMMNTRICLAPRGTVDETFRMYEGLRAGCLVITNMLPDEPFLKDAPVIQVDHWKVLPALMKRYARDLDALEHYRQAGLAFWGNRLSEPVIGAQVAKFLNAADRARG